MCETISENQCYILVDFLKNGQRAGEVNDKLFVYLSK